MYYMFTLYKGCNMKQRIISIVLILCMFGTLMFNVEAAEPVGTPNTFRVMISGASPIGTTDNVLVYPELGRDQCEQLGVTQAAAQCWEELKKLPEGYRTINIVSLSYGFEEYHDELFDVHPSEKIKTRTETLAKAFYDMGADIDYLIDDFEVPLDAERFSKVVWEKLRLDNETTLISQTYNRLGIDRFEEEIKNLMEEYVQTEFYKETIRPMLVERGFTFGTNYELEYVNLSPKGTGPIKDKFWELADTLPEGAVQAYDIFTEVVRSLQADAYNECIYEPFKKYYPDIRVANYSYWGYSGEIPYTTMFNETAVVDGKPHLEHNFGNGSLPVFYGTFYNWQKYPNEAYPYDEVKVNSFNLLLQQWMQSYDIGYTAERYNLSYTPNIMTKGASFTEGSLYWHNFRGTPYYDEAVTHYALHGADMILLFIYIGAKKQDILDVSRIMHEMDYMCGFEDRKPIFFDHNDINEIPKWDQRYVLSGMYAGGRNVWRITPDLYTPGVSVENFCIDRKTPTFQIGNQFIEFPEGSKIVEPEDDRKEYGYWVTSPEGTKPKQYRDLSLPEPDQQHDLVDGDEEPMGYAFEPIGNGVASKVYDFTVQKKPSKVETEDSEVTDEPEFITIDIKPISFENKVTPLVARDLPMDIAGHWSIDTMSHMYALGVINGTEIGLEPDKEVTKAEFLTMLFRALQVKSTAYEGGISDLRQGEWYADTVYTALNGGWITTDANGNVNAEKPLSREDMAVIMMKAIGENEEAEQTITHFTDEASISKDAISAVRQAVGLSVLKGNADGSFSPKKICTRAEAATMIENYFMTLR